MEQTKILKFIAGLLIILGASLFYSAYVIDKEIGRLDNVRLK